MYRFVLLGGGIFVINIYKYKMVIKNDNIKDKKH